MCQTHVRHRQQWPACFNKKWTTTLKEQWVSPLGIGSFIYKNMTPYNVVKNDFHELLYPPQHFSQTFKPSLFNQVTDEAKHEIMKAGWVATDGQTSCSTTCATETAVTVICGHIDTDWRVKHYVLQTCFGWHTRANPCPVLKKSVRDFSYQGRFYILSRQWLGSWPGSSDPPCHLKLFVSLYRQSLGDVLE